MRMKGVHVCALVGMAIGATVFGPSDADAVLCVAKNKKGVVTKVTIRGAACKGKESVGDPSVLLGLPTTTTSPTTTTRLPPLTGAAPRIVDGAGSDVGWLTQIAGAGVMAVRTIDDQAMAIPMRSSGPGFTSASNSRIDDFQYGWVHQGTQCVGDRFSLSDGADAVIPGDLLKFVFPSADGKSGYVFTREVTEVSTGSYSEDAFAFKCQEPLDPLPPTVSCDDIDPPPFPEGVVTPVGGAFSCRSSASTTCTCIRCCVTRSVQPPDPPITLYRVQTVDLGLGNVTPPFKIAP
jgi:hypothetical protein